MSKKINFNQIKNHLKDNKVSLLLLLAILLIGTGTTYALWQLTFSQTSTNVITTDCFKIEFEEQNDINLENAYPVTDEEGKKLVPYTFTIKNICNSKADYYVNLETVTSVDKKLSEKYLRASLRKGEEEVFLNNLNDTFINLDKVIETSTNAYKLYQGKLSANETVTFNLNLWLDETLEALDEVMDSSYEGKITVTSSYRNTSAMSGVMQKIDYVYGVNQTYYGADIKYMDTLSKVVFQDTMIPINNAVEVKDFSAEQDESVLAYYVRNQDTETESYTLYIQANGKIKVNPVASYYFTDYSILTTPVYDIITGDLLFEGIENLDTSLVTDMSHMFDGLSKMSELDLSTFDTSNVTNMSNMFFSAEKLINLDLSSFDTSKVTDMSNMFRACDSLTNLNLSAFDTSNVTNMQNMFYGSNNLANLDLSNFNTRNVTNMSSMFEECSSINALDLSSFSNNKVTDMSNMFKKCNSLTNLNLSNFDTNNVINMAYMFSYCKNLASLNLSNFNTRNVTDMSSMFEECSSINALDLSSFSNNKVTDMSNMFKNCTSLTNLNLSNFDTSNVTNMESMFEYCSSLTNLDLSSLNTSNVIYMSFMFYGCSNLTNLNLDNFDTSKVKNFYKFFWNCAKLTTTITIMNSNATSYSDMFYSAATEEGAQITVNYTAGTSDLVDQMIATKSDTSNVVKGTLIS